MTTTKKETVEYFIKKFEAIPEEKWCVEDFNVEGKSCAFGHCGCIDSDSLTEESIELGLLFAKYTKSGVTAINDGLYPPFNKGHPRSNILAALYEMKGMV